MHPAVQIIIAVSCLALVGMGAFLVLDSREPVEVVEVEPPAPSVQRAQDAYCRTMRGLTAAQRSEIGYDEARSRCFSD